MNPINPKSSLWPRYPYLWICLLGFLVYAYSLSFEIIYLDDNSYFIDNAHFLSDINNIFNIFQFTPYINHSGTYYRPIPTVTYMLNMFLSGSSLVGLHLGTILVHLCAACLLFLFFSKLKYRRAFSFMVSMVFVVHPCLVSSVAHIPGRNESLLAAFFFLSMITFINYTDNPKWSNYFPHLFCFALALFTKESGLIIPLLCILYTLLIKKENVLSIKYYLLAFSWLIIAGFWFTLRDNAIGHYPGVTVSKIFLNMIAATPVVLQYLGKMLLPFNLCAQPLPQDTTYIYGILSLILVCAAVFLTKTRRNNYSLFGLTIFLLFMYPSLSMTFTLKSSVGLIAPEHRVYLPLIGLGVILLETDFFRRFDPANILHKGLWAGLLVLFSGLTLLHSNTFRDRQTFWLSAVSTAPDSSFAHTKLGSTFYDLKRFDLAEQEFQTSLRIDPQEVSSLINLAGIDTMQKHYAEAESLLDQVLAIEPENQDLRAVVQKRLADIHKRLKQERTGTGK